MVDEGSYLTVGEAVERLTSQPHPVPMSDQTLRRMAERGEIPTIRIGARRDRRFPAEAIDALKQRMWAEGHPDDAPPTT